MVTHDGGKKQKQLNTRIEIETKSETEKNPTRSLLLRFHRVIAVFFPCFTFTLAAVRDRGCCFCRFQSMVECRGNREN